MCRFSRGRAFIFLIIWTHWDQKSLICLQLAVSCFCLQSYCIFSSRLVPPSCVSACSPKQSSVFCPEEERGQNNNRASVWRNSLSNGLLCLWSPLKRLQRGSAGRTTNTQKCIDHSERWCQPSSELRLNSHTHILHFTHPQCERIILLVKQ